MAIRGISRFRGVLLSMTRLFCYGCVALGAILTASSALADASAKVDADRLIAAAAEAEAAGDGIKALSLLNDAVRGDPDNQLARWQLGQVKTGGKWISAEEVQRRAAASPIQSDYA